MGSFIPILGKNWPKNNPFLGKTWDWKISLLGIKWDFKNPCLVLLALSFPILGFPKEISLKSQLFSFLNPKWGFWNFSCVLLNSNSCTLCQRVNQEIWLVCGFYIEGRLPYSIGGNTKTSPHVTLHVIVAWGLRFSPKYQRDWDKWHGYWKSLLLAAKVNITPKRLIDTQHYKHHKRKESLVLGLKDQGTSDRLSTCFWAAL